MFVGEACFVAGEVFQMDYRVESVYLVNVMFCTGCFEAFRSS